MITDGQKETEDKINFETKIEENILIFTASFKNEEIKFLIYLVLVSCDLKFNNDTSNKKR